MLVSEGSREVIKLNFLISQKLKPGRLDQSKVTLSFGGKSRSKTKCLDIQSRTFSINLAFVDPTFLSAQMATKVYGACVTAFPPLSQIPIYTEEGL